jgi:uncharacterized membrane protein YhiD involved in acid resistance
MWATFIVLLAKLLVGLLIAGVLLGVSIPFAPEYAGAWTVWLVALASVAAVFALTHRRPPPEE